MLDFYAKTYFYGIRVNRKFQPMGKVLLGFAAASFLLVWDPSKLAMRVGFTLSLSAFAVAALLNILRQPRSLTFTRQLPDRVVEGAAFEYVILVKNNGRFASPPLRCRDHGRLRFPTERDWLTTTPPFDAQLNVFDRWTGYPKWIWLVETLQDVIGCDFEIPPIPPGKTVQIEAQGRAGRRGNRHFVGFYCGLLDPFGLLQRLFYSKLKQTLLVLPKPLHSGIGIPLGSRSLSLGDSRDLRKAGDSEEFRSLREWRSGDPIKRLDWKATARRGSPVAREYAPEYKLRTALAFDTYLPHDIDEKAFEDAMGYAAGLAVSIDRKDRNIDLLVVEEHVVSLRLGQGDHDHILALERLASCSPSDSSSLEELEASLLGAAARFSSAVLVCPAWTHRHAQLAAKLTAHGMGLAILVCSAPSEGSFPLGAAVKIMDADRL
jgi:uncharacterized protein (DUF58 family)